MVWCELSGDQPQLSLTSGLSLELHDDILDSIDVRGVVSQITTDHQYEFKAEDVQIMLVARSGTRVRMLMEDSSPGDRFHDIEGSHYLMMACD